ncbi:MAG: DUF1598 domain-containing protein [Thermoguttaceae bacterium]|jgi:hypothetical protein
MRSHLSVCIVLLAAVLAAPTWVFAQGGVAVDAQGVLQRKELADQGGRLTRERALAAKAALNPKVAAYSKLRKVSLNRLEKAIADHQNVLTDEMRYLAGLLRVRYVFYYPETKDIVLAGPAEGWTTDVVGRVIGIGSGRPVIQLEDLVVALRAFPSGGDPTKFIGCSIDPTQEGLAAMQQFLRSIGSTNPNVTPEYIVSGLQSNLGLQTISVMGVPPKTHFAQVMVEADYRMKLIGIGLEKPPVRLVSYVDRASPTGVARNALQRWFFTPDYQCVRTADDGLAMELVGDGVKLVGEDELVMAGGQRKVAGRADRASQAFVSSFTKVYSELADRSPVYAQLRNLIDLIVTSAYIEQQDFYGKADWKMELFGDEKEFPVETCNAPKQVAAAINAIWKGSRLMTPIGGGVNIQPAQFLQTDHRLPDADGHVAKLRQQTKIELAKGQWWWD